MDVNETIGWDDVEEAARKMFTVWINGNELRLGGVLLGSGL